MSDFLGNLFNSQKRLFAPHRTSAMDGPVGRAHERTGNFRGEPAVPGLEGQATGQEVERSETGDPLYDWYQKLNQDAPVQPTYRVGTNPGLEQQLAAMLGWSGEEPMSEVMNAAMGERGVRFAEQWGPGQEVSVEAVMALIRRGLGM